MLTWLADFHERTDLNKYPIALRTRGGIGYQVGNQIVSNFVGHPVHYKHGQEWLPITLQHDKGQFEGIDFGWNGYAVTYKKKVLYTPQSVTFNGVVRPLNFFLDADNHRLVAYISGIGEYEIVYSEKGVSERLTIPEPLDGLLTFEVAHADKPNDLYKHDRKIVDTDLIGDSYLLTPEMSYPMLIDPDYSGHTNDGYTQGTDTTYSSARSTSDAYSDSDTYAYIGQMTGYDIYRGHFKFDTSGIPDADTITQANAKLTCVLDQSTADFDVVIVKQDWSAQDPLSAGNREAAYDGCLSASTDALWRNTSGMSLNTQYTSNDLDVSRISKTGYTYYGVISQEDINNSAPTSNERIRIAVTNNSTSAYRPVLTVAHSAGGENTSNFFSLF